MDNYFLFFKIFLGFTENKRHHPDWRHPAVCDSKSKLDFESWRSANSRVNT